MSKLIIIDFSISIIDFIENIGFIDKLILYSINRRENCNKRIKIKNAKHSQKQFPSTICLKNFLNSFFISYYCLILVSM